MEDITSAVLRTDVTSAVATILLEQGMPVSDE
jgi:hypothetical protein